MIAPGRRLYIEWWLALALVILVAVAMSRSVDSDAVGATRVDQIAFDALRRLTSVAVDERLLVIDIDDASLEQIGHWPWPRVLHAELLRRIASGHPLAIGADLLLVEPAEGDELLGAEVKRIVDAAIPVVFAVSTVGSRGLTTALYPVYAVGQAASLGHVHFQVDEDGVVRGLDLAEGGNAAFALELAKGARLTGLAPSAQAALRSVGDAERDRQLASGNWDVSPAVLLPRLHEPARHVSYAAVLRGEIDVQTFSGKIVLIGATASGLGDRYATGTITGQQLAAGVDLHTVAFTALVDDRLAVGVDPLLQSALAVAVLVVAMALLYRLTPRNGLIATVACAALALVLAAVLLRAGRWWPPGGCLTALAIAYPWWNWRRLEAATTGLVDYAGQLAPTPFEPPLQLTSRSKTDSAGGGKSNPASASGKARPLPSEPISRSVALLGVAAERSVSLRRFLVDLLEHLPHPALVIDSNGRLLFANRRLKADFDSQPQVGSPVDGWLHAQTGLARPIASGTESTDDHGRDWLLDSAQLDDPEWGRVDLLQWVDISPIRAVQREREQTMRFVSHDLRSPQVTILSIIEQQARDGTLPAWLRDIRKEATRSLQLANGFVELARAEGATIANTLVDLVIVIDEARDASWRVAHDAGVRLLVDAPVDEAPVRGDAHLLRRALVNLIDNAIKYGRPNGQVTIALRSHVEGFAMSVSDQGTDLDTAHLRQLFQPFWRAASQADKPGVGLGLSFVRVVAERHHGRVDVHRVPAGGACFELLLPRATLESSPHVANAI